MYFLLPRSATFPNTSGAALSEVGECAAGAALDAGGRSIGLLNHVRQFVRQQVPPGGRVRRRRIAAEDDVVAERVGACVHLPRRLLGSRTGMHPHLGKVVAEALLHILT